MATHGIGKFKFSFSKEGGLSYRWGEGEEHRLFARGKAQDGDAAYDENEQDYAPEDYDAQQDYADEQGDYGDAGYEEDGGYDDPGYGDDRDYDDARYDDGDYQDSRYDDGGDYDDARYDDGDYRDSRYDDGDYDEEYDGRAYDDDGYDDDRAYDDDGYGDDRGYDDGYYGEDGYDQGGYDQDGYDQGGYGDDGYEGGEAGEYYGEESALMRYVDEHDWVTYALLVLCPPLGIYLLWRRNRFEKPVRWAVSAASAIWFVFLMYLLIRALAGGTGDTSAPENPTVVTTPVPTTAITTVAPQTSAGTDISAQSTAGAQDQTAVEPTATPLANTGNSQTEGYVYSPATGLYYHRINTCPNIPEGAALSLVTVAQAQNTRKQSACPQCIGGSDTQTYYATAGGTYYHLDQTCSNMRNPSVYTKEAAETAGKLPCPVCVTHTQTNPDDAAKNGKAVFINNGTTDRSGVEVYATKGGTYFHLNSTCSNMQGASKVSLKTALLAGKRACPTCCPTAGTLVYCTAGGKSYHLDKSCQGMNNAKQVTLAEAMVLGKTKCDVCIKGNAAAAATAATNAATANTNRLDTAGGGTVYVWGTDGGKYYHTNSTCSGMKNAKQYTLRAMLLEKRQACPVCAKNAGDKVYASAGGTYYHSYATCSGMTNANAGTLAQALAYGYRRCPKCWTNNATANNTANAGANVTTADQKTNTAASVTATASNTYVYGTANGSYYHLKSNCSGMTNAKRVTLKTAVAAGKTPCPTCASVATRVVYSTDNGKNYHAYASCEQSGMKNGKQRTLAQALMMNQTACRYCMSSTATPAATVATAAKATTAKTASTYKNGTSGIKVYASTTSKYFHTKSNCSGMTNASRVTLETALNAGKTACPTCASSAGRTVYVVKGGKYYHYSQAEAGTGAKAVTRAQALGYGYDACPNCVTKTAKATTTTTYKSGTSGVKVYATKAGAYYHAKADCSGMTDPLYVTLEQALNAGKKACPTCLSAGNRTVYGKTSDPYYHLYQSHAGTGAKAATLAKALALGKKICPVCNQASSSSQNKNNGKEVSTVTYGASADTRVYVDVTDSGSYYHKSAKCSKAGVTDGVSVTLQYAKEWGFRACPYCNPPTAIAETT